MLQQQQRYVGHANSLFLGRGGFTPRRCDFSRHLAGFPLQSLPDHITLAPLDGDEAPEDDPEERNRPINAIGGGRRYLGYYGNDGKWNRENKGRYRPEDGLDIEHASEARASFVAGGEGFAVGSTGADIDGHDIFHKIIRSRQHLSENISTRTTQGRGNGTRFKEHVPSRLLP